MRSFLAGFNDEHICRNVCLADLDEEEEDGVIESSASSNASPNPVMR